MDPESLAAGAGGAGTASPAPGGWRVQHVYGSPDSKERRLSGGGSIMRVRLPAWPDEHQSRAAALHMSTQAVSGWSGVGSNHLGPALASAALQVHTLFPAAKSEEGIKGGVVLLRMLPPPGCTLATAPPLKLSARYTDRWGGAAGCMLAPFGSRVGDSPVAGICLPCGSLLPASPLPPALPFPKQGRPAVQYAAGGGGPRRGRRRRRLLLPEQRREEGCGDGAPGGCPAELVRGRERLPCDMLC